jgi:ribulose-bisphosphate carboxylase small chain
MMELDHCRKVHGDSYIRVNAFDSVRGFETVRMSFIVNRPKNEPKIDMTRTDVRGRTQNYSWKMVRG